MRFSFWLRSLAALAVLALCAPASAQQAEHLRIAAIHAQLYHERTATFSADILAPGSNVALWNTIIGEDASNFTLVTVEVRGHDLPVGAISLDVSATDGRGRTLAHRRIPVSIYDENRSFFAPLFLYGTGCDPVTISARLSGPGAPRNAVTRAIPFRCGE
ncbi:MAG: hypothetical protein ABUL55_03100 [Pseudomonadota bacterium]